MSQPICITNSPEYHKWVPENPPLPLSLRDKYRYFESEYWMCSRGCGHRISLEEFKEIQIRQHSGRDPRNPIYGNYKWFM